MSCSSLLSSLESEENFQPLPIILRCSLDLYYSVVTNKAFSIDFYYFKLSSLILTPISAICAFNLIISSLPSNHQFIAICCHGTKHVLQISNNFKVFADTLVVEQIESLECGETVKSALVYDVDDVITCVAKTATKHQ